MTRELRAACGWATFVFFSLALGARVDAQTGLTGGAVQGTVRDPSGDPLADVAVSLIGEGTGLTWTTTTDAGGRYFIGHPQGSFPPVAVGGHL